MLDMVKRWVLDETFKKCRLSSIGSPGAHSKFYVIALFLICLQLSAAICILCA